MKRINLSSTEPDLTYDWYGNNAAFTCPHCNKVFIVSALLNKQGRECPKCSKSTGHINGSINTNGNAFIEY